MCTYSANPEPERAGRPTDFHLGHYVARAAGGAGLVMIEATGVSPEGRISPYDLGLWSNDQTEDFRRLASAISAAGAVPAIQLAHAGRKASVDRPWRGGTPLTEGTLGWQAVGPSSVAFPGYPAPHELTRADISDVVEAFSQAARRARSAGFEVAEVHAAHGYLLHSFLSPVSNLRTDDYGGSLENRARLVLEVIDAVRAVWADDRPVFLRVSTTDWIAENPADNRSSWTIEDTVTLATWATGHGIDLVDCSSGGTDSVPIPRDRDYQTKYARQVRTEAGVTVGAVGRIADPAYAAELVETGSADALFIGRALLRDPSWVNNAASQFGATPRFIEQYDYAL